MNVSGFSENSGDGVKGKVLVICGPTASGKTALAAKCAKTLDSEVISADSMLIYKGLNIGTAKPTAEEKMGVPHHMIDVAEPTENFSVSDYEKLALPLVKDLLTRGKTPVICGGTGFYINALLYKSGFGGAGADETVRKKYEAFAKEKGVSALHELLKKKDPESAEILHPHDVKRVVRALEIFDVTGKKKSEQRDERIPRFPFVCMSVDYPREILYERIDARVEKMFADGLKTEVERLKAHGVTTEYSCMQAIGYKEVAEGVLCGKSDVEIMEEVKKHTRNYAKRQITFFKRMQSHIYLRPEEATPERVLKLLQQS